MYKLFRKQIIIIILLVILILSIIIFNIFYTKENAVESFFSPIMNKVILIDPGHGGFDPGAIGSDDKNEDTINLEIALRLRRLIEQGGGIVILTREDENGLDSEQSKSIRERKNEDMRNRRILIEQIDPEVFISIHINSFPQSKYYGAQTFYKSGSEKSKLLATKVQDEFKNILDEDNKRRPQSRNSVYLVNKAENTSILIEAGFISNPKEERLLNNPKYQEKIAWSIYIGLIKYFNDVEKLSK